MNGQNSEDQLLLPGPALSCIVGSEPLTRGQIFRGIVNYIRQKGLRDTAPPHQIRADRALTDVFGDSMPISWYQLANLLSRHLPRLATVSAAQPHPLPADRVPPSSRAPVRKGRLSDALKEMGLGPGSSMVFTIGARSNAPSSQAASASEAGGRRVPRRVTEAELATLFDTMSICAPDTGERGAALTPSGWLYAVGTTDAMPDGSPVVIDSTGAPHPCTSWRTQLPAKGCDLCGDIDCPGGSAGCVRARGEG